jgi:N-acetylneuraminic acid mutarotase
VSVKVAALALVSLLAAGATWQSGPPLPLPRSEVAGALVSGRIAVVGGLLPDGQNSARVDAFDVRAQVWRRFPDLPVTVDHAMATSARGRLYVVGGYGSDRRPLGAGYVLSGGSWISLPAPPEARAAGGAAIVGTRLYVAGGVAPTGLARTMLVFDLVRRRWAAVPGPTAREHLAVTATGGRIYALGGRTAGFDTNTRLVETYDPRTKRWSRLPPLPDARGGTGAAAVGATILSVGGEATTGTIPSVFALNTRTRRWRRLPNLPTPRHGLAVVAASGRVYAIGGGPEPGLHVSNANESLRVG